MEVSQKDANEGTSKKNNDGTLKKNKEVHVFPDVSHFVAFSVWMSFNFMHIHV